MSALEAIVEDLKTLPPEKMEDAAWFVHALAVGTAKWRAEVLARTAASLSAADVDDMERAIAESCEEGDDHDW